MKLVENVPELRRKLENEERREFSASTSSVALLTKSRELDQVQADQKRMTERAKNAEKVLEV